MRMAELRCNNNIASVIHQAPDNFCVPLLKTTLIDFFQKNISYCYWKSHRRVASVMAGNGDVDLLVSCSDQHRAKTILLANGFKAFPSIPSRGHPSIISFLGHDETTGQLVHIHLHHRLILGERLLKNYRLPWEEAMLARTILHPTFPIKTLDPAFESLLLVVRACLELHTFDPVSWRLRAATCRKFATD